MKTGKTTIGLLAVLSLNFCLIDTNFPPHVLRNVTMDIMRKYFCRCVYLLHSTQQGSSQNTMMMGIAKSYIPTALTSTGKKNITTTDITCVPLYVIICCDKTTKLALKEVISWSRQSNGKLLIFMDVTTSLEKFFGHIYIPLDCDVLVAQHSARMQEGNFEVSFTEVYHVHPSRPLQMHTIGYWSSRDGITWSTVPSYKRRGNLLGAIINGSILSQPPYIYCENNCTTGQKGFIMELWREFESRMNFTIFYKRPTKGSYGSRDENGSWTGIIGLIVNGEAEVGINVLDFETPRLEAVDYFPPVWNLKKMLHIREPGFEAFSSGQLFLPFTPKMWLTILLAVLTFTVLLLSTSYFGNKCRDGRKYDRYDFFESLVNVFGILCMQSREVKPGSPRSCFALILTLYFTVVVVFTAYSSVLISFITVMQHDLPFTDFEGVLEDGTYRVGITGGSVRQDYFQVSKERVLKEVYRKLIAPWSDNAPLSAADGLRRICTENKYAFVASNTIYLGLKQDLPCSVVGVPNAYYSKTVSVVMRKGSQYKKLFNHHMQELRRTGIIKHSIDKTWPPNYKEVIQEMPSSVTFDMVQVIFVFFAIGALLSFLVLSVEIAVCHTFRKVAVPKRHIH